MTAATHLVAGTYLDEIGVAGWAVVYIFTIRQGFKDKSYGIPMAAICLNITWEAFFAFACKPSLGHELCFTGTDLIFVRVWAIFDVIIFYQLLRFGRAQQDAPLLKNRVGFCATIAAFLVIGYLGQTSYIISHRDISGDEMAWISSLIMNILFILAVFQPHGTAGFSVPAAWAKLVANACIAGGLIAIDLEPFRHQYAPHFVYFLFATVFLTDVAYIVVLHWRLKRPSLLLGG